MINKTNSAKDDIVAPIALFTFTIVHVNLSALQGAAKLASTLSVSCARLTAGQLTTLLITVRDQSTRPTQPFILSGSTKVVTEVNGRTRGERCGLPPT